MMNTTQTTTTARWWHAASLLLASVLLLLATLPVQAQWTNNQAAINVIGQPNFTTNTANSPSRSASTLRLPRGVAVDPTSAKVFVADTSNNRVLRYTSASAMLNGQAAEGVFGQADFVSAAVPVNPTASSMNQPFAVFVDNAGRLWVADFSNNRVLRFDNAATKANGANADGVLGQTLFTTKSTSVPPTASSMFSPDGLFADGAGHLWVADRFNSRVLRFDNAAAKANGAPADGVLGQLDLMTNGNTTAQNRMWFPIGLFVDGAGRLWVVDSSNQRVLRFDSAATKANGANADGVLGQPNFTTFSGGTPQSGFSNPFGVYGDPDGRIYVGDQDNNRVMIFNNAAAKADGAPADNELGQPNFNSGTPNNGGVSATSFNAPQHLFFDNATYSLYVTDVSNNRVTRYTIPPPPLNFMIAPSDVRLSADYDGDGKNDLAIWRPSTGVWWIYNSSTGSVSTVTLGMMGDVPVPGDYDGDGRTDPAIWRPATGAWLIVNSSTGSTSSYSWGVPGDVPVPGDYDGDGKADLAIWRPATGAWWIYQSSNGAGVMLTWGGPGDVPVPGDYDGDHRTDVAIWRQATGTWWIYQSSTGSFRTVVLGVIGDRPVPGDYDGDGKTDAAIWRPATGAWLIVNSTNGSTSTLSWGVPGDVPVPGDFDGDGKTDLAIWRPSTGVWWIYNSSTGSITTVSWGVPGDLPIS